MPTSRRERDNGELWREAERRGDGPTASPRDETDAVLDELKHLDVSAAPSEHTPEPAASVAPAPTAAPARAPVFVPRTLGWPTWLLGQRVAVGADRIVITLDKRVRVGLALVVLALGAVGFASAFAPPWRLLASIERATGLPDVFPVVVALGVLLVVFGVSVLMRTPWGAPTRIVADARGLTFGARTIAATELTSIFRAANASRDVRWVLVIATRAGSERLDLGGRFRWASPAPLDQLAAALCRVLGLEG